MSRFIVLELIYHPSDIFACVLSRFGKTNRSLRCVYLALEIREINASYSRQFAWFEHLVNLLLF
jgi:hypothetical protein